MFDRKAEVAADHDAVSEVLLGMRLRGARYWRLRLSAPFGIGFEPGDGPRFHFVGQGSAMLLMPDGETRAMNTGDAVLIPKGHPHKIVSSPRVATRGFSSFEPAPICEAFCEIRECDPSLCRTTDTTILTGAMELDLTTMHPLVSFMPEAMSVGSLMERQPEMHPILAAMEREMAQDRPGSVGILARFADVVAALIVRGWVECGCDNLSGVVTALRDPKLARVLVALHKNPAADWSVTSMAQVMGASRSVFSDRFTAVVGISPLRYVTELRMRMAAQWLDREAVPLAHLAHRLGYGSQAAFTRAFKRVIGISPGNYRRSTVSGKPTV